MASSSFNPLCGRVLNGFQPLTCYNGGEISVQFSALFSLYLFFFLTKMCLVKPLFYKFGEEFILMSKFWDSDGMQHGPSRDLFIQLVIQLFSYFPPLVCCLMKCHWYISINVFVRSLLLISGDPNSSFIRLIFVLLLDL